MDISQSSLSSSESEEEPESETKESEEKDCTETSAEVEPQGAVGSSLAGGHVHLQVEAQPDSDSVEEFLPEEASERHVGDNLLGNLQPDQDSEGSSAEMAVSTFYQSFVKSAEALVPSSSASATWQGMAVGGDARGHCEYRERRLQSYVVDIQEVLDQDDVVDLARARRLRQERHFDRMCLACWEREREVILLPCSHCPVCFRCFLDPYFCLQYPMHCPQCGRHCTGCRFTEPCLRRVLRDSQTK